MFSEQVQEGDLAEGYRKTRLPATRLLAIETMKIGVKAHYVKGLLERHHRGLLKLTTVTTL
jgi:hypothetical protein